MFKKGSHSSSLPIQKKGSHVTVYKNYSLLYRTIEPFLSKNKDIIVETGHDYIQNPTLLLRGRRSRHKSIESLYITWDNIRLKGISDIFKNSPGTINDGTVLFLGGDSNGIKTEAKILNRPHKIAVGTGSRIIDHLRRGNIDLSLVETVLIDAPVEESFSDYAADVEFIYSKLPRKKNSIFLIPKLHSNISQISNFLRLPKIIEKDSWRKVAVTQSSILVPESDSIEEAIFKLLIARYNKSVICVTEKGTTQQLCSFLRSQGITAICWDSLLTTDEQNDIIRDFKNNKIEIIVTSISNPRFKSIQCAATIICHYIPTPKQYLELYSCLEDCPLARSICIIYKKEQEALVKEFQEQLVVTMNKETLPSAEEITVGMINTILQKIKTQEDPEELKELYKTIKKQIPFNLRSYFTAYLLKNHIMNKESLPNSMHQIFIGIGKNRKVYPRDISNLLLTVPGVASTDIGQIKILDNYSFVEIANGLETKIIEQLNGIDFKGRKLAVNFARKKGHSTATE